MCLVFKALTHKQIQYFVFNKISIKKIIVLYEIHFRDVKIQTIKKLPICGSSNEGLLAPWNNTICFFSLDWAEPTMGCLSYERPTEVAREGTLG